MKTAVNGISGIQTLNRNRVVIKMQLSSDFDDLMKKYEDKIETIEVMKVKVIYLS